MLMNIMLFLLVIIIKNEDFRVSCWINGKFELQQIREGGWLIQ